MPVREAPDRRGRAQRGSSGLLEREAPLREIDQVLDAAADGLGTALLIEGHAGMGKTRLHEASLDGARAREMRVLRAAGAELELEVAFGVARTLLEAELTSLPAARRDSLLAGAPHSIRALIGLDDEPAGAGTDLVLSHAVFTLLATADESRPTLIAIDDLHWCDTQSLEFILYLLHRLDELPFALVMTRRSGAGNGAFEVLERIAAHEHVQVQGLAPLGTVAVGELARRKLGEPADRTVASACRTVTAGNPFYLHELLQALREEETRSSQALAKRALELAPDAVIRTLRVRVGRLGAEAAALARAVAILGDDVPLRQAAALAGVSVQSASAAADGLAAVEILLAREPLRFVHPLVRQAIADDIPASERSSRHLDAARLLYADGTPSERVAAHLLLGRAEGDPWVIEQLRAAAREARARGAAQSVVSYLQRALEEPASGDEQTELLAELGDVGARLGLASSPEFLAAAAQRTEDPTRRAQLALRRGQALEVQGLHQEAAAAYEFGLAELGEADSDACMIELRDALATGFVASALVIPALHDAAATRSAELLRRAESSPGRPITAGQRRLLAQASMRGAWAGDPARAVVELAKRAWSDGRLLEDETSEGISWSLVAASLTLGGELERAIEVADAALRDATARSSPLAFANANYSRSIPRLWQGRVNDAIADLELARDARRFGWRQFARAASAFHAQGLIERGDLDGAERALSEEGAVGPADDLEEVLRLAAQAQLRLAQGRGRDALGDALAAGRGLTTLPGSKFVPWRAMAAEGALAAGELEQAVALAHENLEIAQRFGAPHGLIRAHRVLGLVETRELGLESLRTAVELGHSLPPRLETIRALVDLGSALRRANRRTAAREPLQRAIDLAWAGGAIALHERARTELAATGARPRRDALLSGPDSLTPSERRIAELAASGQSNREIAQALFVTPKTVEYHLRNAYRKLGIERRGDLKGALAGA